MYKKDLNPGDVAEINSEKQSFYNLKTHTRLENKEYIKVIVLNKLLRDEIPDTFNYNLTWYKVLYENEIYITPVRINVKLLKSK